MSNFITWFTSLCDWSQMNTAIKDTLFMTLSSLVVSVLIGLIIGIILYVTQEDGLYQNKIIYAILNFIVNVLRAIPFIILLIVLLPLTQLLVGSMLGAKAALPALIFSSAPFYARMCMIALTEIDKGTIEACKAMGASNKDLIFKVLLPEAKPALVSAITVMGISLIGYTAMAGAIGAGGLGYLAYTYGFARNNKSVMYLATIIVVAIVFLIQGIGDYITRKIDKR